MGDPGAVDSRSQERRDDRWKLSGEKSSMASSMCCAVGVPGVCYPMICPIGVPSTCISGMETGWDLGTGQYSEASDNCALLWAEKPNRARPSWIVNRSKPVLSVAMSAATTGGNKIHGRKRHLLVDTQGLLIRVKVLAANITDRDGVAILLTRWICQGGWRQLSSPTSGNCTNRIAHGHAAMLL